MARRPGRGGLTTADASLTSKRTVTVHGRVIGQRRFWSHALFRVLGRTLLMLSCFVLPGIAQARSALDEARQGAPAVPDDFSSIDSGWILMRYHPEQSALARKLMLEAEPFRREVRGLLGSEPESPSAPLTEKVEVRIGRTPLEMEKLGPSGLRYPQYASGLALPRSRLILLTATPRFPGENHDLVQIFRHELAHVAMADRVGVGQVPRWFDEGFAVYASGEGEMMRMQTLWTATLARRLIPFAELSARFPEDAQTASIAYAQAADVIRYLLRGDGEHRFHAIFSRMNKSQTFESAVQDAYGEDLGLLEVEYRADAARRYTFWPILFASSTIWGLAAALFVLAYYRKRRQASVKLARWAREEAVEDQLRARLEALQMPAIRIIVAETSREQESAEQSDAVRFSRGSLGGGVPFVEHEGSRHTLH